MPNNTIISINPDLTRSFSAPPLSTPPVGELALVPVAPLPAFHDAIVIALVYPPNIFTVVVCGPGNVVRLPTSLTSLLPGTPWGRETGLKNVWPAPNLKPNSDAHLSLLRMAEQSKFCARAAALAMEAGSPIKERS